MYSVIGEIYAREFCPKDASPQQAWAQSEMFYIGFCMGARMVLEIMQCAEFDR